MSPQNREDCCCNFLAIKTKLVSTFVLLYFYISPWQNHDLHEVKRNIAIFTSWLSLLVACGAPNCCSPLEYFIGIMHARWGLVLLFFINLYDLIFTLAQDVLKKRGLWSGAWAPFVCPFGYPPNCQSIIACYYFCTWSIHKVMYFFRILILV